MRFGAAKPREYLGLHVCVGNGALDIPPHGVHRVKKCLVLQVVGYSIQPLPLRGGLKRARIVQVMPGCRSDQHTQKAILEYAY